MRATKQIISLLILLSATRTLAQNNQVIISGMLKDKVDKTALSFSNIIIKTEKDSAFITGTVSNEEGQFILPAISPGAYVIECSLVGYSTYKQALFVGSLSMYLDIGTIELTGSQTILKEVVISAKQDEVGSGLDKKVYRIEDNVSQAGGSVLQSMANLPGVIIQDGKIQLRGNDRVAILIDGKQSAITGFGNQSGLDNIPASSIERIELINNPSSTYDANGNAGIINIIMKKTIQEGLNGKFGFSGGLGALGIKKANLPDVRPQYQFTPKANPSLSLNYRKNKLNIFLQSDNLYTHTLNKNEFVDRYYEDGTYIYQQLKRNRNTNFFSSRLGIDYAFNDKNTLGLSVLFGSEKILDKGDQPFFNGSDGERLRLWQFLEDELKTTLMGTANYLHKFKQPGHSLNIGINFTFHRENEKYYFDNILPASVGQDAFKLLSDEKVLDFTTDYIKPLKYGRIETGIKIRKRDIPTNMQFFPGINSPLDTNAGGWANYREIIPAIYSNYVYENKHYEAEVGIRYEYVKLRYDVNPNHPTYKSNGYNYFQPFPTVRFGYKINSQNKLSVFYNRRVDRPNEVDIRIFPKYDDAEIIKVGNPSLRPQFTNSLEFGYKKSWSEGYFYSAVYHRISEGTITRISSIIPGSTLIYAVFQNAGKSYNSGLEFVLSQKMNKWYSFNLNLNAYRNQIDAFTTVNKYPIETVYSSTKQGILSGSLKLNNQFSILNNFEGQITAIYLAPDILPQGKIAQRFSVDLGIKKLIQQGKGELFLSATDIFNTMVIKKQLQGAGFRYTSLDYYETQVVRMGYTYKF